MWRCHPWHPSRQVRSQQHRGERGKVLISRAPALRSPLSYQPLATVCSADGFCSRSNASAAASQIPAPESSGTSPDSGAMANPTSQKRKGSPIRGTHVSPEPQHWSLTLTTEPLGSSARQMPFACLGDPREQLGLDIFPLE